MNDATYTLVLTSDELDALRESLRHDANAAPPLQRIRSQLATIEPDEEGDGCCEYCPIHGGF